MKGMVDSQDKTLKTRLNGIKLGGPWTEVAELKSARLSWRQFNSIGKVCRRAV